MNTAYEYSSRHGSFMIVTLRAYGESPNSNRYTDVIMSTIASQITSLATAYSTVCSDAEQRKYLVMGIHW